MAKGRKTGGRKPGSVNKTTATVKEALLAAAAGIGGIERLTQWADENPTEFYKLYARLVPTETEVSGKDGAPLTGAVVVFGGQQIPL